MWINRRFWMLLLLAPLTTTRGETLASLRAAFIETHCAECHDDSVSKGDFDITALAFELKNTANRGQWARVFDLVEKGEMPPPEKSKVGGDERKQFVAGLADELLSASKVEIGKNGRGPVRRLTRVEFENNLRALLKLPSLDIRDKVGSTNLSLQYDIYHMQIMEGDLARTVEGNLAAINHVQLADNPGRNEPGTGEINYRFLFEHLDRIGYQGWIGCEYKPATTTAAGLGWLKTHNAI